VIKRHLFSQSAAPCTPCRKQVMRPGTALYRELPLFMN
jgi:hypothetical protein